MCTVLPQVWQADYRPIKKVCIRKISVRIYLFLHKQICLGQGLTLLSCRKNFYSSRFTKHWIYPDGRRATYVNETHYFNAIPKDVLSLACCALRCLNMSYKYHRILED
jgi:hypothetical protein